MQRGLTASAAMVAGGIACSALLSPRAAPAADPPALEMQAASAEELSLPHDIVLSPDGSRLYVADNGNHRIVVLDPRSLRERGTFAGGEVSEPHDVAFDATGRLLVADTGNSRIAIFAVEGDGGTFIGEHRGSVRRPEGVAAHADGRVAATGAASGNLVIYRDGRVVAEVGGFSSPHDVAFDDGGAIWVADASNDRIVRLDGDLRITRVLEGAPYGFSGPRYLDFDADGRLYVADKYTHRIKIIDPDGTLLAVLGGTGAGKGPGLFDRPEGVEIRGRDVWSTLR